MRCCECAWTTRRFSSGCIWRHKISRKDVHQASHMFSLATMTALQKNDGGCAESPRDSSDRKERVCAPFQFALCTRAGVDCVGHAVRTVTDMDPRATVLCVFARASFWCDALALNGNAVVVGVMFAFSAVLCMWKSWRFHLSRF